MATIVSGPRGPSSTPVDMCHPRYVVRVPASTSNCGAGFDTLGLAFNLYNEVSLQRREEPGILYTGRDSRFGEREMAMIQQVADAFFAATEQAPFGFSFKIEGEVPLARGLGSSVTVRAGILGGLNAAAGVPLSNNQIIEIVTRLEGHPDNAAAAVLGGFCVARTTPDAHQFIDAITFAVPPDLVFVVVSPDLEIETEVSRRALPQQLPFSEVVKSLNSLAFLVSVFATGEFEKLQGAITDHIHQPYRLPHIAGAEDSIAAGVEAGAYTGWLSGSGSSVLCVAHERHVATVATAMAEVFAKRDITCSVRTLLADNHGLSVSIAHD